MMKRTIFAAAILALMSVPAFADTNTGGGNDCTGNCPNNGGTGGGTYTNTVSPTITVSPTNTNVNVNAPSNTNSNSNSVTVSPTINNASSATGGNASASAQGGNASANNAGNTQSVNIKNPATVGAISVSVAASGTCTGQATAVSGGFTMFSVGVSHISIDPECSKREAFRLGISSDDPEIRSLARKVFLDLDAVKAVEDK